jgi:hypothetical protein
MQRLLLAILIILSAQCGASQLSIGTGLDYSSGKYGSASATDTWLLPLNFKYASGDYSLKLVVPYLWVRGPQTVTPEGVPIPGGGVVKTTQGIGDVTASLTANAVDDRSHLLGLDLVAKIKFGTASESKALGTGKNDYALQTSFFKTIGSFDPYLDIGYRWYGDPVGIDYRNVWYGTVGSGYRFNKFWSVGADYTWRQKLTVSGDQVSEATIYANHKFTNNNKVIVYGVAGFSHASPDWGLGLTLTHNY